MTLCLSLGDRMKAYETVFRYTLPFRQPIILRVDGKAFRTYTKGTTQPFDLNFNSCMDSVAIDLLKCVQGAQLAYVQSDEVSLLIYYYKLFNSEPWYGNNIQKICGVSASQASVTMTLNSSKIFGSIKPALFDSRVFILPEADISNYFIWRRRDAERNSVQALARYLFGPKEIFRKNKETLAKMCSEKGRSIAGEPMGVMSGRVFLKGKESKLEKLDAKCVNFFSLVEKCTTLID